MGLIENMPADDTPDETERAVIRLMIHLLSGSEDSTERTAGLALFVAGYAAGKGTAFDELIAVRDCNTFLDCLRQAKERYGL